MKKLAEHGFDVYSQAGEDGIIDKIFELIGTTSKVSIEFGAWDGFYLSNTANLWSRKGWKGILIELDSEKFKALRENVKAHGCRCINAKVEPHGDNSLENILRREGVEGEIDLLSIDIDGDDYYIFDSLSRLKPRLIICEYNPTIPAEMDLVPERGNYFGCSARSLVRLAEKKGYRLVAVTDANCFFVRDADFPRFAEYETLLPSIAVTKFLTYCLTGYGGDYALSREPTYGFDHPTTQKFAVGEVFRIDPKPVAKRKLFNSRRLSKLTGKRSHSEERPFLALEEETRTLWARWEKEFAPRAHEFVHPLWQKARPAFFPLFQNGPLHKFLSHAEVAHQFCRGGFNAPQQYELNYLRTRPRALSDLARKYKESPVGSPAIDCAELKISANSLGMLYYFTRIAEKTDLKSLRAIVEFGGGYGCLSRVFQELLPSSPTYVIVDLPEMLALQHYFLRASSPERRVVTHFAPPTTLESGATHLVPVQHAQSLPLAPDLFVSTFALSETPQKLQESIAARRFFGAQSVYLVGQETDAKMWEHAALDSNQGLRSAVSREFEEVLIEPYHFASAWELRASRPKAVVLSGGK
jgi:putative sugar O-methyltransferase